MTTVPAFPAAKSAEEMPSKAPALSERIKAEARAVRRMERLLAQMPFDVGQMALERLAREYGLQVLGRTSFTTV